MIKTIVVTIACYELLRFSFLSGFKFYRKKKTEKENLQKFFEDISKLENRDLIDEPWIYEMQRTMLEESVRKKNQFTNLK